MARIGCLGDVIFEVSDKTVETLDNMTWTGTARYSVHNRHRRDALTEFTGLSPDKISFDITLSAYLNVDVQTEIAKLWGYERTGQAVPLVIGDKAYGKYRWNITSHKASISSWDAKGNAAVATVSVDLQEYLRN